MPNYDSNQKDPLELTEKEVQEMIRMENYLIKRTQKREEEIDFALSQIVVLDLEMSSIANTFDQTNSATGKRNRKNNLEKMKKLGEEMKEKREEKEKMKERYNKMLKAQKLKDRYNEIYFECESLTFELGYCKTREDVEDIQRQVVERLKELDELRVSRFNLEKSIQEDLLKTKRAMV